MTTAQVASIATRISALLTIPACITRTDVDELRHLGLEDDAIFDIAATAAARAFFTKVLEAVGTEPDSPLGELDEDAHGPLFSAVCPISSSGAPSSSLAAISRFLWVCCDIVGVERPE